MIKICTCKFQLFYLKFSSTPGELYLTFSVVQFREVCTVFTMFYGAWNFSSCLSIVSSCVECCCRAAAVAGWCDGGVGCPPATGCWWWAAGWWWRLWWRVIWWWFSSPLPPPCWWCCCWCCWWSWDAPPDEDDDDPWLLPLFFFSPFGTVFSRSVSFFIFILRFWNQILTCLSVKFNAVASLVRRSRVRYMLRMNSFSSS